MSGLEQAIRNALERAERSDPDIRSRIYQSARNALDAGLRKQDINDTAVIERQRQRLEATIRDIEDEELVRLRSIAQFERVALEREPEPEADPEPESTPIADPVPAATGGQPSGSRTEPTFASAPPAAAELLDAEFEDESAEIEATRAAPVRDERSASRGETVMDVEPEQRSPRNSARPVMDEASLDGVSATRDAETASRAADAHSSARQDDVGEHLAPARPRGRRSGGFLVSAFVYLFLFAIIGGGVWWVYDTGMIDAALEGRSDFQLVPEALQSQSDPAETGQRLETLRGFSGDWIDIYKPGPNASVVKARDKAAIEEHRDSDGLATVITSNAPDQDGDVLVEIPASFLQEISGKTSTLAVTVKSNSDKPAQIYVQCEFKSLGDCGRHRYTVTNERADKLIQVKFEGKLAPSGPGHIVINSDLTGEGSSIRLYGIRVLPGS
ncbi:MAG: hypothetical protein KL863_20825 [Rhizobium sp.]|nr:hypothetical protein [Rhizobium sp.]